MIVSSEHGRLADFRPEHASQIAGWVENNQQLLWLAPSTDPPLTAAKVIAWCKPGGRAYVYRREVADDHRQAGEILGYAELNRMGHNPNGWWIGHFVVSPLHRGRGVGRALLRSLAVQAFERLAATSLCLVVFPDNQCAIRCYEAAGFSFAGEEFHRFGLRRVRHRLLRYEMQRGT